MQKIKKTPELKSFKTLKVSLCEIKNFPLCLCSCKSNAQKILRFES